MQPESDAPDLSLVGLVVTTHSEIAFRLLHRRHAPRLYRVALRMLGTEVEAEDAVQEMWLRAVPKFADFEGRSALGTWLTTIVMNVCREMLEKRGRWVTVELSEDLPGLDTPSQIFASEIERAIASLPPACRAAFILHDVEGFTHEDVGLQLGVTAGTSKSQVFRARRTLRRLLAGAREEEPAHES